MQRPAVPYLPGFRAFSQEVQIPGRAHQPSGTIAAAGRRWTENFRPTARAAFTMKTYVHATDENLRQGTKTLARIHKIA
jgi:hypothetical protein